MNIIDFIRLSDNLFTQLPTNGFLFHLFSKPESIRFQEVAKAWVSTARTLAPLVDLYQTHGKGLAWTPAHSIYMFLEQYGNQVTTTAVRITDQYAAFGNAVEPEEFADDAKKVVALLFSANRTFVTTKVMMFNLVSAYEKLKLTDSFLQSDILTRVFVPSKEAGDKHGLATTLRFRKNVRRDGGPAFTVLGDVSPALAVSSSDLYRVANGDAGPLEADDYGYTPIDDAMLKDPPPPLEEDVEGIHLEDGQIDIPINDDWSVVVGGEWEEGGPRVDLGVKVETDWDQSVGDWISDVIDGISGAFDCY